MASRSRPLSRSKQTPDEPPEPPRPDSPVRGSMAQPSASSGASPQKSPGTGALPGTVAPGTTDATLKPISHNALMESSGLLYALPSKERKHASVIEMLEYVKGLDIDPIKDSDMLWIAEEAFNTPLPPGWTEHQDDQGKTYFHCATTSESVWRHPMDDLFRDMVGYQRRVVESAGFWEVEDDIAGLEESIRSDLADWMELFDDQGEKFYYNRRTDESRFDDPRMAVYHSLYSRIKMVAKMKERLPSLAGNVRPDLQTQEDIERKRRKSAEEDRTLKMLIRIQSLGRMIIAKNRVKAARVKAVVHKGPQPLRGQMRLRMEKVGANGSQELVLSETTPHRRSKAASRIQARARGNDDRKRVRPMIEHRRYQSKLMTKVQTVARMWLARRKVARRRIDGGNRAAANIQNEVMPNSKGFGIYFRQHILPCPSAFLQGMHKVFLEPGSRAAAAAEAAEAQAKAPKPVAQAAAAGVPASEEDVLRSRAKAALTSGNLANAMMQVKGASPAVAAAEGFTAEVESAEASKPQDEEALRSRAKSALTSGNLANAMKQVKAASSEANPPAQDEEALRSRVKAALTSGNLANAIEQIKLASPEASEPRQEEEQPQEEEVLRSRAKAALTSGNLANAMKQVKGSSQESQPAPEQERQSRGPEDDQAATQMQANWRGWRARRHVEGLHEEALLPLKTWFEFFPTGPDAVQMEVRFVPNPRFEEDKYSTAYGQSSDLPVDKEVQDGAEVGAGGDLASTAEEIERRIYEDNQMSKAEEERPRLEEAQVEDQQRSLDNEGSASVPPETAAAQGEPEEEREPVEEGEPGKAAEPAEPSKSDSGSASKLESQRETEERQPSEEAQERPSSKPAQERQSSKAKPKSRDPPEQPSEPSMSSSAPAPAATAKARQATGPPKPAKVAQAKGRPAVSKAKPTMASESELEPSSMADDSTVRLSSTADSTVTLTPAKAASRSKASPKQQTKSTKSTDNNVQSESDDDLATADFTAPSLPPVQPPTRKVKRTLVSTSQAQSLLAAAESRYRDIPPMGSVPRPPIPDRMHAPTPPSGANRTPVVASAHAKASALKQSQSDGAIEGLKEAELTAPQSPASLGAVVPPRRRHYGGRLVGKEFIRNAAESIDDMTHQEQQQCLADIETRRLATHEELKVRKKRQKAQQSQYQEARQQKYDNEMGAAEALQEDRRRRKVKELKKWLKCKEEQVKAKKEKDEAMMNEIIEKEAAKSEGKRILEEKRVEERERRLKVGEKQKANIEAQMLLSRAERAEKRSAHGSQELQSGYPSSRTHQAADHAEFTPMDPSQQRVVHRHIHHHVHYHEGNSPGSPGSPLDEEGSPSEDETPCSVQNASCVSTEEQRQIEMASEARVRAQLETSEQAAADGERHQSHHFHQHLGMPLDSRGATPTSESMRRAQSMGALVDSNERTQEAFYRGAIPRDMAPNVEELGRRRGVPKYAAGITKAFSSYADAGRPQYGRTNAERPKNLISHASSGGRSGRS